MLRVATPSATSLRLYCVHGDSKGLTGSLERLGSTGLTGSQNIDFRKGSLVPTPLVQKKPCENGWAQRVAYKGSKVLVEKYEAHLVFVKKTNEGRETVTLSYSRASIDKFAQTFMRILRNYEENVKQKTIVNSMVHPNIS